jgi:hypothetical protein
MTAATVGPGRLIRLERLQTATRRREATEESIPFARSGDAKERFIVRRGVAILIAAYALFCHGCHGDEDNELFASGRPSGPIAASATSQQSFRIPVPQVRYSEPVLSSEPGHGFGVPNPWHPKAKP